MRPQDSPAQMIKTIEAFSRVVFRLDLPHLFTLTGAVLDASRNPFEGVIDVA